MARAAFSKAAGVLMPKQAHAKERHSERNLANLQGKAFIETHSEAFRNNSNRIRL
jgi:hypothetical protein